MNNDSAAQKERQLNLILELDRARDAPEVMDDPNYMFRAIATLLKSTFNADACAIMLVDEASDEIESIVAFGVPDDMAIDLCRQAMGFKTPTSLKTSLWSNTLGLQIVLQDDQYPLGSFFLASKTTAFTDDDIELLDIAESQIDSAIVQARLVWKLAHRNMELEAIYQIDRMRDDNPDESDLINNFTLLLSDHFKADLCMLLLSHVDSGEMVVRGIMDKQELPGSVLEAIHNLTTDIRSPQIIPTPPGLKEKLNLLAAPFIVGGTRLGTAIVGRKAPYTIGENRLIFAMVSQMDSAIVHSRVMQQLTQRNKELESIYRIDQIRDSETDFDTMLHQVLGELCKAVASEIGYLMLYNEGGEAPLELKATTRDGIITAPGYIETINKYSREALDTARTVYSNVAEDGIRSIVAVPLILNERIIGVFGAVNSANARGFSAEDRRMLTAITSQVDTAVFERLERRQMRKVLSRSVDPKVLEHLLQHADDNVLAGERVVLSVLFADLRGSTEWAERTDPEELVHTLNEFLSKMTDVIFKHGGTLDKFVGDEVIALFGCPVPMDDHPQHAVRAALEMQAVHKELQAFFAAQGHELPSLGVGISSGEVIAGEFGPPVRTDFTAIGRVMNLGARLCGAAGPDEVYISLGTHEALEGFADDEPLTPLNLKGLGATVPVFKVLSIKDV
ncbi:MAG: adenylate/guanylate cyclase domain-containing protein [Aggregatilineales bacterium]